MGAKALLIGFKLQILE